MIPGSFSRYCRVFAAAAALLTIADAAVACSGRLHVEVAESGVYGLDYDTVIAAQPALKDCRATDLVLLHKGEEIPIRVVDDGHGAFAAGSRIVLVIGLNRRPDRQVNYGSGKDVNSETIADAKWPVRVRWHARSYVEIPTGPGRERAPVVAVRRGR